RTRVVPLARLAALAACGERAAAPTAADDPGLSATKTAAPEPDRQRLEQLARRLARALSDPAFRLRLKQDLDRSLVREHKLHFQRLVTAGARPAAADLARATGASVATVTSEALTAPALELYLPVPAHRARWTGDANLLVATALHDHEAPVAFDPSGRRRLLDPDTPPDTPVLALVPVETDFDHAEARVGESATEICPQTVGTAPAGEVEAQACQGTGGGTPTPGLWMTAAWFVGTFEGWLKGAPEFEVHMLGQAGATDSLKTYQCAGEKQPPPYWFDQNSTSWTGSALLASQGQIDTYNQQHPGQNMRVVVIEDDDTACQIKIDAGRFKSIITLIDSYNNSLTAGRDTTTGLIRVWNRAKAIQKILQAIWSFITTQDEFVGNAVQDAVAGEYKAGYNWIVKGENNVTNGALKLEMR
ncbi:MAG TPA: hypothetical protein VI297_04045, partial [Gemmatimonadales bacterium]